MGGDAVFLVVGILPVLAGTLYGVLKPGNGADSPQRGA